ncbi:hypothetical protein ACFLRC_02540 [Candidatus Altiarchaeota archaeon]
MRGNGFLIPDNRGYVYTLITVILVLAIISLNLHYSRVASEESKSQINQIQTDELQALVASVKNDFRRTLAISGWRAAVFTTLYIIDNQVNFENYTMVPCPPLYGFDYRENGSTAAIAELMLCGTINGSGEETLGYMNNHTLLNWSDRMNQYGEDMNANLNITFVDIFIAPYDAWSFAIVGKINIFAEDKLGWSSYAVYNIPVPASVEINNIEDPLNSVLTGVPGLTSVFTPCHPESYPEINGSVLDEWIESGCHLSETAWWPGGVSFFDRLDGNTVTTDKYKDLREEIRLALGETEGDPSMNLEVILDLDEWWAQNINTSVDIEKSWVDNIYFTDTTFFCHPVDSNHSEMVIDPKHTYEYYISHGFGDYPRSALDCFVTISNVSSNYTFDPPAISSGLARQLNDTPFPVGVNFTWINEGNLSCNLTIALINITSQKFEWVVNQTVMPGENFSYMFTNYSYYVFSPPNPYEGVPHVFGCNVSARLVDNMPKGYTAEVCVLEPYLDFHYYDEPHSVVC